MRVFNPSSTPIPLGDALIGGGEHGDVDDTDRVRELIDAGLLVESEQQKPDKTDDDTSTAKRGAK